MVDGGVADRPLKSATPLPSMLVLDVFDTAVHAFHYAFMLGSFCSGDVVAPAAACMTHEVRHLRLLTGASLRAGLVLKRHQAAAGGLPDEHRHDGNVHCPVRPPEEGQDHPCLKSA